MSKRVRRSVSIGATCMKTSLLQTTAYNINNDDDDVLNS